MSAQSLPGMGGSKLPRSNGNNMEMVMHQRPLKRVLAFTRRSIDDVINCPIAKNEVLGYYKLHCWIRRESQISELEHQWNPMGLRR